MTALIEILIGIALLLIIAFPERFLPGAEQKRKKMGINNWGSYNGTPLPDEEQPTIEAVAIKRKGQVIAGSTTYIGGRGVSGSSTS